MGFIIGCCGVLVFLVVGLLLGGVLVRAAVAAANRCVRRPPPPDPFGDWDDWDSDEPVPKPPEQKRPIPPPNLANAVVISFVAGLVTGAVCMTVSVFASVVGEDFDDLGDAAPALALLVGLPTTFGRGLLVAFWHHLLALVVALVLGGVGLAVWSLTWP